MEKEKIVERIFSRQMEQSKIDKMRNGTEMNNERRTE